MENYEQKYKEAFERAKELHDKHPLGEPPTWTICEQIFPELKESEGEKIRKECIELIASIRTSSDSYYGFKQNEKKTRCIKWLENQKPVEWSEEDKEMISDLIDLLNGGKTTIPTKTYINWLNVIKNRAHLQPKQGWDEKDEKIREGLINMLSQDKEIHGAEINWLKSLRPNHWKPSKEQMEALETTIYISNFGLDIDRLRMLESLYNDLKKL